MLFLFSLFVLLQIGGLVESFGNFSTFVEISPEARHLTSTIPIVDDPLFGFPSQLSLLYDPPNNFNSPTALGVYVRASIMQARVYYDFDGKLPTLSSPSANWDNPYIQIDTPFLYSRNRTITIVAIFNDVTGSVRSPQYVLNYFVEGGARPYSYAFLVPGIETQGIFLRVQLEVAAAARAQASGGQEFADFNTYLGMGTYPEQVQPLHLMQLDSDLTGFEGGYAVNCSNGKHYGLLIPYNNGKKFFGKLVRVDLRGMSNVTSCAESYRMESLDLQGNVVVTGTASAESACVFVLDLASVHPNARGFKKGFVQYPYLNIAPGEFDVPVRINMEKYGILSVKALDLTTVNTALGGYSGGFADGSWVCYNPLRTFVGPIGGLRSSLPVDANHLRSYYHGVMLCIHDNAFNITSGHAVAAANIRTFDISLMSPALRGFSESVRVGRYVYLAPFADISHTYTSKLVRIFLGTVDIGTTLDELVASGAPASSIVSVLDLSQVNPNYGGFSGIFTSGIYVFLVPYRNKHEPQNGQRGHGNFVQLNMNNYDLSGVVGVDLTTFTRSQIPSFADTDLRGFSCGFASGWYALLVPFYNAVFSGKMARLSMYGDFDMKNLQLLDLKEDRASPNIYRGFTGGFVSHWQGVAF